MALNQDISQSDAPLSVGEDLIAKVIAELDRESQTPVDRDIQARKYELHDHLRKWMALSMSARRASYEDKWDRWRRNARNIYDPSLKSRKEKWQNTMFVPITMQNKEIIKSTLYRTLVSELPYSVRNRPSGNLDDALALRTLLLRELELADFELGANDSFDDVLTYGTGFMKIYWDKRMSRRSRRQPIYEQVDDAVLSRIQQTGQPLRVVGYQKMPAERVMVYDDIVAYQVSIWDMFFESFAKSVQSGPHAQRYKITLQEVIDGIMDGYFFQEAYLALKDVNESDIPPNDKHGELADMGISLIQTPKPQNANRYTSYEWWGLLPQKWVYLRPDDQHCITNPEELIPAKCLFTDATLLAVDLNDDYMGESPFLGANYIHCSGSVYGLGVGEMLEQIQEAINEDTNQRKDNVQLILNRMFAMLERAIVSKADLVSRPGGFIRIKSNSTDDVAKAIMPIEQVDVTASSYQETMNGERFAQELTGANRSLIGSGFGSQDITQTKGGLQLIKQSSNDRLAYYAMVIETDFIKKVIKRVYSLIYNHIDQGKILKILGPRLAQKFILRPPEDIEKDYCFEPQGVFSTMNQPIRVSQWQAFRDQFKGAPFFNDIEMAQILAQAIELPEIEKVIVPPTDPLTGQIIPFQMMQQLSMAGQMMTGMFMPPNGPGKAGEKGTRPAITTQKPDKNAEQANP